MVFVLMAVVPFVLKSDFVLSIATFIVIYSIVALSWNLLVGYSGQLSFGHHGFFLVGAYTSAIFVKTVGLPFLAGLAAVEGSDSCWYCHRLSCCEIEGILSGYGDNSFLLRV
jgi:ABC-type branched-subunit amino acid transport system permease subunit